MRERTKVIYRGWNKEIFILQSKNMNVIGLRQIFDELKRLYEGYKIVVIPIEVDFEIK
ncbi:TPA: hypothetical protein PIT14_001883 [Staphylococcus aureus]|uniref:Uncharacterized protein n=1 Tax=Staphylococcus phage vB_SauS_JS02 TaxID=2726708 RepID=A0A6F8Z5E8_9CAUD|nr:hypothetical protein [Staphylococcus aureus]YP_010083272.1 hypothetical protein KMD29_gp29 [Staphylococcus phage vB_SauS_JS02]AUM58117.1 hypothetical protein [Staphylococcus phage phiSa2wa_st80]MBN4896594.1 hypothetical protein [Staphylococcus sp. EG-SA-15]WAX25810.1 hypothetical protein [Staphylococcus phage phiSa2wa-st80.2]WAX25878.1 hypothetical protein [Staphylococcus phage phiSa2wa-st80.4]HDK9093387.1 hypothetical protein [Staphylococcus aureus CC80-24329]